MNNDWCRLFKSFWHRSYMYATFFNNTKRLMIRGKEWNSIPLDLFLFIFDECLHRLMVLFCIIKGGWERIWRNEKGSHPYDYHKNKKASTVPGGMHFVVFPSEFYTLHRGPSRHDVTLGLLNKADNWSRIWHWQDNYKKTCHQIHEFLAVRNYQHPST